MIQSHQLLTEVYNSSQSSFVSQQGKTKFANAYFFYYVNGKQYLS